MKTLQELKELDEGTVVMNLESGIVAYYQKVSEGVEYIYDRWITLGREEEYSSEIIQARSGGRWAVVQVPVIEEDILEVPD